jgi:ElaA protein
VITWRFARFDELDAREVHDILQARSAVFVVEQNCVFLDADGVDPDCWHLFARAPSALGEGRGEGPLLAYCRLVPPGIKFPEASIGRVITPEAGRGRGLGRELMARAVDRANELWPGEPLRIGAQQYLEKFYGEFGFVKCSEPYDEDGIMHIEMKKEKKNGKGSGG